MCRIAKSALLPFCAVLLIAADAPWKNKQIPQWTEGDARQILKGSPWIKKLIPSELSKENEAQRRDGGKMGTGQGVGLGALSPAVLTGVGTQGPGKRRLTSSPATVEVRWESAAPVRAAELKAHDTDAPDWEGNAYVIAVYDVPGLDITEKALAADLKRTSSLKRDGKKDLKPMRVDMLPQVGGLTTVVYLFPRSEEITVEDKRIEFTALFGRLSMAQYFYTAEMRFQGKLEL